jgi:hypothetical protein
MSLIFTLNEFGENIGLSELSLPVMGALSFSLDDGQTFCLVEVEDDLLMYSPISAPHIAVEQWLMLLQACDVRELSPQDPPLQLGVRGSGAETTAVLLLRWPVQGLMAAQLIRGLQRLQDCSQIWLGAHR